MNKMDKFLHDILNHIGNMREDVAETKEWQKQHDKHADVWRKAICDKIDKIMDKLGDLPCNERKHLSKLVYGMWAAIGFMVTTFIIIIRTLHGK